MQTAAGSGQVVALNPADRVQAINALVAGRINRWFVHDGSLVSAGDPIVEIVDIDPRFIERLQAERAALAHRLEAARIATETALLDYQRQERLFEQGLSARREFESAKIRYQEMLSNEAGARAAVSKADIGVSRQSSQIVRAPMGGRIVHIAAGNLATVVKAGEVIATFAPTQVERAVEIFLDGLDAPLVEAGHPVRIMFEGWPAVQFSGWPEAALGTFGGTVWTVDPMASVNGRFRALIREDPSDPWPADRYLRLGGQARAGVQLSKVRLGYELWRQLNRFPPRPPQVQHASGGNAEGDQR
ncbi:MAG: HlyD family efflux transporter periplasmic adaptor subunit [Gammaproteobacteria bacterium]